MEGIWKMRSGKEVAGDDRGDIGGENGKEKKDIGRKRLKREEREREGGRKRGGREGRERERERMSILDDLEK